MHRRSFLTNALTVGAAFAASPAAKSIAKADSIDISQGKGVVVSTTKLTPPAKGGLRVAIPISKGATVIDFAGPWDVFTSVMIPERGQTMSDQMPFQLLLVSEKTDPVVVEGGMKIVPDYAFEKVPECQIVVVPAQADSKSMQEWLRKNAPAADVTMSVCVGVEHLANAGLLEKKSATTHHDFYDRFAKDHPGIDLRRGVRFVENEKISTSGGETCGIDLALRVVARYFGRDVAARTAKFMEYQGTGWVVW